jgi:hypothetical protein
MDVDNLFRNGIIAILLCMVLFAVTGYVAQSPQYAFLEPVKWFILGLAAVIMAIIIIARLSQK